MIYVNLQETPWQPGQMLSDLHRAYTPDADIATINGIKIESAWETVHINDGDKIVLVKGGQVLEESAWRELTSRNILPHVYEAMSSSTIGIAGLGGLGSHVAAALARVWPGKLIIVDFDIVEPSNLNRQQYFCHQVGSYKADAMRENLLQINPYLKIETFRGRLTKDNIPDILGAADIIAECFDRADQKQMLVETVLTRLDAVIVSASGLAGYGRSNAIQTRRLSKRHVLVGDLESASGPGQGLMAPRVGIAALHQANAIVEIIVDQLHAKAKI